MPRHFANYSEYPRHFANCPGLSKNDGFLKMHSTCICDLYASTSSMSQRNSSIIKGVVFLRFRACRCGCCRWRAPEACAVCPSSPALKSCYWISSGPPGCRIKINAIHWWDVWFKQSATYRLFLLFLLLYFVHCVLSSAPQSVISLGYGLFWLKIKISKRKLSKH